MPIQSLPSEVIDQIAAGEVVERPAHMVKELIENSLDAGATEVEVDFSMGGRQVSIKDNGSGIPKDELKLALARHATSKIAVTSDIWNISSYGFRGEALATISAVSRFRITSRSHGSDSGYTVSSQFGIVGDVVAAGSEPGTRVMVEDLFANLPARLKFLKSDAAESIQIKAVFRNLALANPQVSFRLLQNGKLLHYWAGQKDLLSRAEQILEMSPLFVAQGKDGEVQAQVVLAPPNITEKSSKQITVLVQGRVVQDRGLQTAVIDAYRHLMMHGDFPVAVVSVSSPPADLDINIHPTKSQVKFQNPSQAFRAVHRAARSVLEFAPWLEKSQPEPKFAAPVLENMSWQGNEFERTQYSQKQMANPSLPDLKMFAATLKPTPPSFAPTRPAPNVDGVEVKPTSQPSRTVWQNFEVLGQAHLTYIVAQGDQGVVLIDQHAAHERVAFERLMAAWKGGQTDIQTYLLPLTIALEVDQVEALLSLKSELIKLGVDIDASGPSHIAVLAAPSLISEAALSQGLKMMAEQAVQFGDSFALEKVIGDICATLACHSVVRAGQPLSVEQMRALLVQMDEFPLSCFCPHGRPVSVEFPWSRIEREFGRIV